MTVRYTLLETDTFHLQFACLPRDVQTEMSDEILKLRDQPFGEGCKPLVDEFEGVWRIHVGRVNNILYCVAYVVCEDCQDRDLENKIGCLECYKYSWFHIKLVLCGRRDEFYTDLQKNWQTWILTATIIDEQE